MNILYITVRADHGGGPGHVDILINNINMDGQKHDIYVAGPQDKPYYSKWAVNTNVKGYFILPHRKFNFLVLLKLIFFCKKNKIALIHSNGKGAGVYSRLIKLFIFKIKIVHTFNGVHVDKYGWFMKRIYFFYERIFDLLTNFYICVSKGEQDICIKNKLFHESKSTVVYNSIKTPVVSAEKPIELERCEDKFILVTLSRFDFQKNMDYLFEIASTTIHDDSILYVLVGDGPDKERLEKLKLPNVIFTGFKNNPQDYLACSSLYISTARWEGLPFALVESCSLGIPIICTNVVGNNEVVNEGQNGYFFNSSNEAVALIRKIKNDTILLNTLKTNSLGVYNQKFRIENMILKYNEVYHNLISKNFS